jgi:hypothetical protein
MSEVRILNGGLEDDDELGVILRGVVDQESLKHIKMDWYQREQGFSKNHTDEIASAFFLGAKVADITIGMRGHRCTSKNDIYSLLDKCYCIDGGQRLWGAAVALKERPALKIKIGAKIIFGTNEEMENELFCRLGTTQKKISSQILIRNRRKKSAVANLLVSLNSNPAFALESRVGWDQMKTSHELITGFTLARIVAQLHAHKGGGLRTQKVYDLLAALDGVADKIGVESMRGNVIRFFDAIDACWTIRNLGGSWGPHPHLRSEFLTTFAKLVSAYPDFWDGTERHDFYFLDRHVKRLTKFKLAKYVLASARPSQKVLYGMLREQLQLDPLYDNGGETASGPLAGIVTPTPPL